MSAASKTGTTTRAHFVKWHAELMRAVDERTGHASRHRIQPKNAENEARDAVVRIAKRRLAVQHTRTEWFADWMQELLASVDELASQARQNGLESQAVSKARHVVEHRARQIPGDTNSGQEYQYITVVYRLAPEDSLNEILEHPARLTQASGNLCATLNKTLADLARAQAALKERDREALVLQHANEHLQLHLSGSIGLLQTLLFEGQADLPAGQVEAIHDFFAHCNGSSASLPELAQQVPREEAPPPIILSPPTPSNAPTPPPASTTPTGTAPPDTAPALPVVRLVKTIPAPAVVEDQDPAQVPDQIEPIPQSAAQESTESQDPEDVEPPNYPVER